MSETSPRSTPRHLAVIMDGNGRWAEQRRRPRLIGHRAGARAVQTCVEFCLEQDVEALTLFAFSSENWGRPPEEVSGLMKLFTGTLDREVDELHQRGVRLRFIGEPARFSDAIRRRMRAAEALTAGNARMTLAIAASYGGRQDIVAAARALAAEAAAGRLAAGDIDEALFGRHVALADLPPPDLMIRTGGDQRISNFLLWQLAYAELWFTERLWPELDAATLRRAFDDYANRQRRFGLTGAQVDGAAKDPVSQ
ncbi:di-trans,poly-cis-decaprenylcistransferase [Lysobacter pythonis]|uniref:Ditrans,polycis-undecaprenyl-diphosphate synthase ((2E,6E)-farnesyl-diphosphate specific) n=1 Tax=Solilutibacter pythonis TaxID=2483112 RepID=A0A3M2HW53_9GAMM|nr:polyprenyl diphosphate synthase [Lysobacter pythonis]RMH91132.1 di-trans,poly-cis-decaprenylcistransferase [Lysobacter pythonis]